MTSFKYIYRNTYAGLCPYYPYVNAEIMPPHSQGEVTDMMFVVHDTKTELLATLLSIELNPRHEVQPDKSFFRHLYEHNILAYDRSQLEAVEINSEVTERLYALISFSANADLQQVLSALDIRLYGPVEEHNWSCWRDWHMFDWRAIPTH